MKGFWLVRFVVVVVSFLVVIPTRTLAQDDNDNVTTTEEGTTTTTAAAAELLEDVNVTETVTTPPPVSVPTVVEDCCAACPVIDTPSTGGSTTNGEDEKPLRILTYDGGFDLMGIGKSSQAYYEKTGIRVINELLPEFSGVFEEIRSQARSRLPLYDGYIAGPGIVGSAVQLDGFLDLTEIVRDSEDLKWLDVLRGFRENIATYDGKVRMLPLDGDAHFMYYRSDVLEAFDLGVPRTWDEYWQVAQAIHGKEYNNQTMVGSCVGIQKGTHLSFWTSLVLSSYTQTNGPTEGFILDSKDLTPLAGEAMAEAIKMLEFQAKYGHPLVFEHCGGGDGCSINVEAMNDGYCALTYNWGDSYKVSHTNDPEKPSQVAGLLKVAPTPGVTKVYNRNTKKLDDCNEDNCGGLGGTFYDDIGWVNRAAYLAFGGWSAAINNNIDDAQKQRIVDFFVFMCSPENSLGAAIPKANATRSEGNGVDPFRTSHMDVDKWVEQGYERTSAETYKNAVLDTLYNPNAAYDMRFAGADLIYGAIDEEIYNYLEKAILLDTLPSEEEERQKIRMEVAETLDRRFREIIVTENKKPEQLVPLLEQYQRDLGIYSGYLFVALSLMGALPAGYSFLTFVFYLLKKNLFAPTQQQQQPKGPPKDDDQQNLILATVIPIVVAILVGAALIVYFQKKNGKNDSVWQVKEEELIFVDPPEIIGRGTFGEVLLAEYRGTKVAVKRVLPKKETEAGKASRKTNSESGSTGDVENPRVNSLGTSSWAMGSILNSKGMSSSGNGRYGSKSISGSQFYHTLKKDFIKEMRYVSTLRHPCVTTVMGAVISPKSEPMLIMEYMDHGSFYDLLHNKSMLLEGEILLPMLSDITQGCRFLHAAIPQVIHGDLKAANILVDSKFRAKVADFGLSQKKQGGVSTTGTPYWMAPELLREEVGNNAATDVYSFGIILYEAFSRKDPYEGESAPEVLLQVADPKINKRPPVPKGCPSQLAAIMEDCLLANPNERPSFEELDKRLRRIDAETAAPSGQSKDRTTVSLFDIFPKHIAEALRDGKKVEAEHRDAVTIFFCDIVGFTTISSTLDPRKVAKLLDRLYLKFDELSHTHDVFKVETIGDSYMAVTNLVKNQADDHATRIAEFSVAVIRAANETLIDEDDASKGVVNLRVGFHSGSVVADVVGSRNPRYCLFGDTVNTASRMESNSLENRIHCSEEAADFLEKQNCRYKTVPRGIINVKGKGKMRTYWINEGVPAPAPPAPPVPESALPPLEAEAGNWSRVGSAGVVLSATSQN